MGWHIQQSGATRGITRRDRIRWVVLSDGTLHDVSREVNQYCETTPDNQVFCIWQDPPRELRQHKRALVMQCWLYQVRWMFNEKEARLLYEFGALEHIFGAARNIRILVLKDGGQVIAREGQFFQTARDRGSIECWQLHPTMPSRLRGEWYPIPDDSVTLIGQWQISSVHFALSAELLKAAHPRSLLHHFQYRSQP